MQQRQHDPAGLFNQVDYDQTDTPKGRSVIAQIQERPMRQPPPINVPPMKPAPEPASIASQTPITEAPDGIFADLIEQQVVPVVEPAGIFSDLMAAQKNAIPKIPEAIPTIPTTLAQTPQEAPVGIFADLIPQPTAAPIPNPPPFTPREQPGTLPELTAPGPDAITQKLQTEDADYKQALTEWQDWQKSPFRTLGHGGIAGAFSRPEPEPPARSFQDIERDWGNGVQYLRGTELSNILNTIETGKLLPAEEGRIAQFIEPQLPPEIRKQLNTARLTRDKVEILKQQATEEEQQAETFAKESLFLNPAQAARKEGFGKFSESTNVFGRNVAKAGTLGYAFTPDEERLNSDDADIVSDERANRLFYRQQDSKYPVSTFAGNVLGALPHIAATGIALRSARVAHAGLSAKAGVPTQQATNVLASKGAATTTGGRLAMGAGEGAVYDLLSRPEGAEDMTLAENILARAGQVGFGVALGGLFELGILKGGDLYKLAKDKNFDRQLRKEADTAGYGDDTESYLNDLLNIERTEDGRLIATSKRESVTNLPDLEPLSHEPGSLAAQDRPDTIQFPVGELTTPSTVQPARTTGTEPTSGTGATQNQPGTREPITTTQPIERPGTGEAETVVPGRSESPVVEPEKPTLEIKERGLEIVEAPVNELTLSSDVPQFKSGANEKGVVEPLGGTFDRTGVGPIQVWVRNDGSKEVISGRHRLDLALRSGEKTIPAQYHYEADGFGQQQAATMDAILNIREGQGKVIDYVEYIQGSGISKEAADAEGILGRATGQRAYTIATDGSDTLIGSLRGGRITDDAATRIARAAPGNERLQSVGIKAIEDGKSITVAENMVKAVRSMTDDTAMVSSDMFGFDDSAIKQAEELAKKASAKQTEIQRTLSAVQGAAKNPKLAAREGVDVNDPDALKQRIEELKQQKQDWQNWHTNPELAAELRGEIPPAQTKADRETEPGLVQEVPESQGGFFGLTQPTEVELADKAKTQQEATVKAQQEQVELEARTKADNEVAEFELGIQGSGKDVSARQDDLLAGGGAAKVEVETSTGAKEIPATRNDDGSLTVEGKTIPKGGDYVSNTHKDKTTEDELTAGTLFSNPVNLAIRQMASSMNLGESAASAFGGGVYGATFSDEDIGSEQWWLDVMAGSGAATLGMGALRYNRIIGKNSFLSNFTRYLGRQYEKIPGLGRGDPEIKRLKKQQQIMRQIINRQTGQMGQFLAKNFTPSERSEMADIIENRGVPKQANFVARQARELDDFISYTSQRMKELGMLPPDLETGGYLHRYYAKHLKFDLAGDLKNAFKMASKQSLSGTYTIQRGTNETFQAEYLSPAVRQQMAEYDRINGQIKDFEKSGDDLLSDQTGASIDDLKQQLKNLQDIELKEYVGIQNGKPHSFIFMPDEVPVVPGLERATAKPAVSEGDLFQTTKALENKPATVQPTATDRTWSLRGTMGDQPVLWRDWTKVERERWGEITDAGYRYVRGQAEVAHDLSMATMFKKVSDREDWVSNTARTVDGEEWIQVPSGKINSKSPLTKYGALSGKYVKPDVWKALKHYNQPLFGRGRAATVYRNLLNKWKLYKTVYNPVSHFNNTFSNLEMYYMAGYSARSLGTSLSELRQGENSQYWRDARDVNLFGSDEASSLMDVGGEKASSLNDLAELLRNQPDIPDADVVNNSMSVINQFKTWWIESGNAVKNADTKLASGAALAKAMTAPALGVIKKPVKAATDSAKRLYQKEDELFKLAVFIEERKKGKSTYEAMEAANRFFFDYNDLPDAVRRIKDMPFGSPFISYTYLALPAIIRNAVERPERMLALAAAFEGINYASLSMQDKLDDEDYWGYMEAQNKVNPSWQSGRTIWGAMNNIDISAFKPGLDSYKISLANAHAMGNPFAGEGVKDLPLWPGFMAFWGPDPVGSNPFTRIPFDIIFNQDWKGDPLYNDSNIGSKSLAYAYQAMFPTMPLFPASWHQQKIIEGMAGDINKATEEGRQPNRLAEGLVTGANAISEALGFEQFTGADWKGNQFKTSDALSGSVGIKLREYRPKDNYLYQRNKLVSKFDDAKLAYRRKRQGDYTKAQMKRFKTDFKETQEQYKIDIDELKKAFNIIKK